MGSFAGRGFQYEEKSRTQQTENAPRELSRAEGGGKNKKKEKKDALG